VRNLLKQGLTSPAVASGGESKYGFALSACNHKGGIVVIGASGGAYAARGFFAALDVKTGKELWRFHTVPAPPDRTQEQPIYTLPRKGIFFWSPVDAKTPAWNSCPCGRVRPAC
jgi:outer membrane protein assembly factor BamB